MILKMVRELLRIGMHIGVDKVAKLVEFDAVGDGLPSEMAGVIVEGAGFLPFGIPAQHGISYQTRVVAWDAHESKVLRVHRLLDFLKGCLFGSGSRRCLLLFLLEKVGVASHDRGHDGGLADQELIDLTCLLSLMM